MQDEEIFIIDKMEEFIKEKAFLEKDYNLY